MLFNSLLSHPVIAAAINAQNAAKSIEAIKVIRSLVEKPEKHIVSCIGAMDSQYGWTQNPFWTRVTAGIHAMQQYFVAKHCENAMFMAPVAQGFCIEWLKAANESGLDATVIIPSANYIGKPFKEDGIFGTKAMNSLFAQIGTLLISKEAPENNLRHVKMTQLLMIALSDELVIFEDKNNPKQWVETAANIAIATGVKVVKKDVSPFLTAPVVTETPAIPTMKLEIKKGFGPAITLAPTSIIPAAELIRSFAEEIEKPLIVAITKDGVTQKVASEAVEPPKKKRGRPRKNTVATENEEQKLQEQFMALPG
jgi:hypothetical protein